MPAKFQDPEKTVFVSNIEQRVTEELLWELFLQAGPLTNVHIPTDKGTGRNKTFAFITYRSQCSVSYACELFDTLRLFKKPIYCKPTESGGGNKANTPSASSVRTPNISTPVRPTNQNDVTHTPISHDRGRDYDSYNSRDRQRNERKRYGGDYNRSYDTYNDRSPGNYRNHNDPSQAYDGGQRQRYSGSYSPAFQHASMNPMEHSFNRSNSYDVGRHNYEHHSPRNSPSHFGPMRIENDRYNRMNRRQKSQPY